MLRKVNVMIWGFGDGLAGYGLASCGDGRDNRDGNNHMLEGNAEHSRERGVADAIAKVPTCAERDYLTTLNNLLLSLQRF